MSGAPKNPTFLPLVLLSAAIGTPIMGVVWRATSESVFDPWWMRIALSAWCVVLAVLLRREVPRRWRDRSLHLTSIVVTIWVGLLLWGNQFPTTHSSGILVVEVACIASFRSTWGASLYVVGFVAMVLAAGAYVTSPGTSPLMLATTALVLGALVVAIAAQRIALTRALRRSRDALEEKVRDRTADLQSEVEVRRRAEMRALAASDTKSRFLANMSHELRTPLNAILGYAELAREEVAELEGSEPIQHDLEAIHHAGSRLLTLVNDILDLTRVEEGALDLRTESVHITQVVDRALKETAPLAKARGNALITEIAEALPPLTTDPVRLEQILLNLLSNAAKFTEQGTILVRANQRGESLVIAVEDTGIGIAADLLPTLFERFTQADESPTRTVEGTGLGLALSRELAKLLGGELTARSQLGRGSTFTLVLPAI